MNSNFRFNNRALIHSTFRFKCNPESIKSIDFSDSLILILLIVSAFSQPLLHEAFFNPISRFIIMILLGCAYG